MRLARVWAACVVTAVAWLAGSASACPSCASPLEENRQAFVDTTIFLTVVPLVMIGGLIWWIRRKARALDQVHQIPVPDSLLRDASRYSKGR